MNTTSTRIEGHAHRMRPVGSPVALAEARRLLAEAFAPLERTEEVATAAASGRVLAQAVTAPHAVPREPRSLRDGYAVASAHVRPGGRLRLVGALHAGDDPAMVRVAAGTCVQIATGALLPSGADAVVMVESTRREDDGVVLGGAAAPGQHVMAAGADVAQGSVVLPAGLRLGPTRLSVLSALGVARVRVVARPRVRVLATGSEVRPPGHALGRGQVHDANTAALAALLADAGADVETGPVLEDVEEAWRDALADLAGLDALVLTGGSSAGERDLAAPLLASRGAVRFHGVRIKPGMPMLLAVVDGCPVVVLPGFPASCLVDASLLVKPALGRMARQPEGPPWTVQARMAHEVRSAPDVHHVVPVRVDDGQAWSTFRDSSATTSLRDADGYVEVPEGVTHVAAGEPVTVRSF